MMSRLVLVGMVAVLGVTLPSRSSSEGWFTSARLWMIAQLAEWDSGHSREDEGFVVAGPPDSSGRDVARAATHATAPAAFEPIPIDQAPECGIADELNRMAEGLAIPAGATPIEESRPDFVPAPASNSIEMRLAAEFCRLAEGWEADGTLASRTAHRAPEAETVDAIDEIFEETIGVFGPRAEGLASDTQAESLPNATQSNVDLIEPVADCKLSIIEELNRLGEGVEDRPEDAGIRPVRSRTFEPIEVPADLGSGTAYELNRASEGLGIIPMEARGLDDTRLRGEANDPGIGRAVRLTREAAFAWMNLLTGPEPVEMTSR